MARKSSFKIWDALSIAVAVTGIMLTAYFVVLRPELAITLQQTNPVAFYVLLIPFLVTSEAQILLFAGLKKLKIIGA